MTQALPAKLSATSLLDAISQGEGAFIEFKSSFQKEVIETLTAFANTQGGALLIGVSDAGQVVGVSVQAETIQGWINQCKQITSPRVIPDIELVQVESKTVAIVSIGEYRSANDSTVKVFDDRIEFFNPGALLDDLTVEKIKTGNYKSHLRNKQIATIFKELELIEKYGSGVRRVIDSFVAYGLPEPEFEATQGGMAVTVFASVNVGVNVGVNGLLPYIQSHPGQRAGDIATAFKLTQRTIERWLKQLKEDGLIEFRGAPKTGGYYCKNTLNQPPAPVK